METEIYQTDDISRIISFLQEQGLLNRSFRCHKCNASMELKDRAAGDKKTWRCPKYSCQTFKSVRAGSWFDSNRIQLTKILKLIFAYVSNNTVSRTATALGICRSTIKNHSIIYKII
jgi:hypothetical protein